MLQLLPHLHLQLDGLPSYPPAELAVQVGGQLQAAAQLSVQALQGAEAAHTSWDLEAGSRRHSMDRLMHQGHM
jgi:hypothetical protein